MSNHLGKRRDRVRHVSLIWRSYENSKDVVDEWCFEVRQTYRQEGDMYLRHASKAQGCSKPKEYYERRYYRPERAFRALLQEALSEYRTWAHALRWGWSFWT